VLDADDHAVFGAGGLLAAVGERALLGVATHGGEEDGEGGGAAGGGKIGHRVGDRIARMMEIAWKIH